MSWWRKEIPTLVDAIEQTKNMPVSRICSYVRARVKYRAEPTNRWQTPEETLRRGKGDCVDYAILIRALCRAHGHPCEITVIMPGGLKGAGHVIVSGLGWYASNGHYHMAYDAVTDAARALGWDRRKLITVIPTEYQIDQWVAA